MTALMWPESPAMIQSHEAVRNRSEVVSEVGVKLSHVADAPAS